MCPWDQFIAKKTLQFISISHGLLLWIALQPLDRKDMHLKISQSLTTILLTKSERKRIDIQFRSCPLFMKWR